MRTQPQVELPKTPPQAAPDKSHRSHNRRDDDAAFSKALDQSSSKTTSSRADKPFEKTASSSEGKSHAARSPADKLSNKPTAQENNDYNESNADLKPTDAVPVAIVLAKTPVAADESLDAVVDQSLLLTTNDLADAALQDKIPFIDQPLALPKMPDNWLQATLEKASLSAEIDQPLSNPLSNSLSNKLAPGLAAIANIQTLAISIPQTNNEHVVSTPGQASTIAASVAAIAAVPIPNAPSGKNAALIGSVPLGTAASAATDVASTAALLPVIALFDSAKLGPDIPASGPQGKNDFIASLTTPTTIPSQATPATQTENLHAVAKAIGTTSPKAPVEKSSEPVLTQTRTTAEVPVLNNNQQGQTPPVTAVKVSSEAVSAQNQLAQNGNAMEKAVTHQVQRALVQQMPNGERMMVLRLTPPELGTVRIELIERQGVLSARFHAEDDGVRLALERFLPSMRAELRASDAPIRELTLSDQAQFQRSFTDGQQHQQQAQDGSPNRPQRANQPQFSLDAVRPEAPLVPRVQTLGGTIDSQSVDALA